MTKISPKDRIQALKRSPMYAKDYKVYLKEYKKRSPDEIDIIGIIPSHPSTKKNEAYFVLSRAAKKLCKKYNLRYPIDPKTPFHESDLIRLCSPINYFIPREFVHELQECLTGGENDINMVGKKLTSYLDNRITIMIDQTFSKDMIEAEFKKIVDDWSKISQNRIKGNEIDIWEVYDKHKIEKNPLIQCAVEMLASGNQPGANTEDDRKYKMIKRAYEKACKIVAAVEKQAQNIK